MPGRFSKNNNADQLYSVPYVTRWSEIPKLTGNFAHTFKLTVYYIFPNTFPKHGSPQ